MADETLDPTTMTALQRHGTLSPTGIEQFDASSADKSPTLKDVNDIALVPRGINVSVAGLLKCDFADGTTGTIYVTQGHNAACVTKVYHTGSDAAVLAGSTAFLY